MAVSERLKVVGFVAVGIALAGCIDPAPQMPAATTAPTAPRGAVPASTPLVIATAATTTAQAASADHTAWQRIAQQLEAENRQLKVERDQYRNELGRYQRGYDRAVAELTRRTEVCVAAMESAARQLPRPAQARRPWCDLPQVQVVDDRVFVNGRAYNFGTGDWSGAVVVELLFNGSILATQRAPLAIAAGGTTTYSAQFRHAGEGYGTYAAQAHAE